MFMPNNNTALRIHVILINISRKENAQRHKNQLRLKEGKVTYMYDVKKEHGINGILTQNAKHK